MKNKKPLIKKICAFLGIALVLATCLANCFTVSAVSHDEHDSEVKWIPNYDGTHQAYEYCYDCEEILDNEFYNMSEPCYYQNGTTCIYCKAVKPCEVHTFSIYSNECEVCGFECPHSYDHIDAYEHIDGEHKHKKYTVCSLCRIDMGGETSILDCLYDNDYCCVYCDYLCGHYDSEVSTIAPKVDLEGYHVITTTCSKCYALIRAETVLCNFDNYGVCADCGYKYTPPSSCEHLGEDTNTYHMISSTKHIKYYVCVDCGVTWLEKEEDCSFVDGRCVCGNVEYITPPDDTTETPPDDTTETPVGDFTDLFTGIYDGMLNVFYKMTNFELLGYNIANLILGIFTLVVVIIIAKKVI